MRNLNQTVIKKCKVRRDSKNHAEKRDCISWGLVGTGGRQEGVRSEEPKPDRDKGV